jgi:osmotically-inducible protein OsmY
MLARGSIGLGRLTWVVTLLACGASAAAMQDNRAAPQSKSATEQAILDALGRDPAIAGYAIDTSMRRGRVVLRGRVGTHAVHNLAVQTAMSVTPAIDDELVIDTGEIFRRQPAVVTGPVAVGMVPGGVAGPQLTSGWIAAPPGYIYPPPLLGRIDDPFFGLEPPVISYPPWWGRLTAVRRAGLVRGPAGRVEQPAAPSAPADSRTLEMDLDEQGVATVRGRVASDEEKTAVIEQLERTPGVKRVVDQIEVGAPPPPEPGNPLEEEVPKTPEKASEKASGLDPEARDAGPVVRVVDGVAHLSGRVESVVEAMRRYREAEAHPEVRRVDDRLEFPPPSGRGKNPLLEVVPRGDVTRYLEAQLRRHLGEAAEVNEVRFEGDSLVVRGTVADVAGRLRALAVVRTMAILRGIDVEPSFAALRK